MDRRLATTAALLSILHPGIGHLYLRAWVRAGLWLGATLLVVVVAIPPEVLTYALVGGATIPATASEVPLWLVAGLCLAPRLLGAVDAWMEVRRSGRSDERVRCGTCTRRLEPGVDFCHWCLQSEEATE